MARKSAQIALSYVRSHAEALGLTDLARASARRRGGLVAATAWEHDTLGRSLLDAGELEAAAREFERAADLRPEDLRAHFDRLLLQRARAPSATADSHYNHLVTPRPF